MSKARTGRNDLPQVPVGRGTLPPADETRTPADETRTKRGPRDKEWWTRQGAHQQPPAALGGVWYGQHQATPEEIEWLRKQEEKNRALRAEERQRERKDREAAEKYWKAERERYEAERERYRREAAEHETYLRRQAAAAAAQQPPPEPPQEPPKQEGPEAKPPARKPGSGPMPTRPVQSTTQPPPPPKPSANTPKFEPPEPTDPIDPWGTKGRPPVTIKVKLPADVIAILKQQKLLWPAGTSYDTLITYAIRQFFFIQPERRKARLHELINDETHRQQSLITQADSVCGRIIDTHFPLTEFSMLEPTPGYDGVTRLFGRNYKQAVLGKSRGRLPDIRIKPGTRTGVIRRSQLPFVTKESKSI